MVKHVTPTVNKAPFLVVSPAAPAPVAQETLQAIGPKVKEKTVTQPVDVAGTRAPRRRSVTTPVPQLPEKDTRTPP